MILTREQLRWAKSQLNIDFRLSHSPFLCPRDFFETTEHLYDELSDAQITISCLQQQNTELQQELDAYRKDGYLKIGRGVLLVSEQYLTEKDVEIMALRAERDKAIARSSVIGWRP